MSETSLLLTCSGLALLAGIIRYRMRLQIISLKARLAHLRAESSRMLSQLHLAEEQLSYAELQERRFTIDCRDLARQLQEVQGNIRELEELRERRMAKSQDAEPK